MTAFATKERSYAFARGQRQAGSEWGQGTLPIENRKRPRHGE